MNRKRYHELMTRLERAGFSYDEANKLRRIEMTLQRWSELECGDEHGRAIERDEVTEKPYMTYESGMNGKRRRYLVADRERGALKRLGKIMQAHPDYVAYHQSDPRGCALYLVPKAELDRSLAPIDAIYSRGLAVCE